jgi:N-acetylmuramoyl-L-alanine amidase
MSINIIVDNIPFNTAHNRRPYLNLKPTSITIHSTANASSTAKSERAWLTNPSNLRTASWHYCIDEKDCVNAIPPHYVAWHAGDGSGSKSGNMTSIAIEMCESGNRALVLQRAKELAVQLMIQEKITVIKFHHDWSGKNCPEILTEAQRQEFKAEIMAMYKEATTPKPAPAPVKPVVKPVVAPAPKPVAAKPVVAPVEVIKSGDNGQEVKDVQFMLIKVNDANLTVDGDFGPATVKAVKDFQAKYNLGADGIVGPKTLAKLKALYNG